MLTLPVWLAPIAFFAGCAAFAGGFYMISKRSGRRRERALRDIADGRGFSFSPVEDQAIEAHFADFAFFNRHRRKTPLRRVVNIVRGEIDGAAFIAFDYLWSCGFDARLDALETVVLFPDLPMKSDIDLVLVRRPSPEANAALVRHRNKGADWLIEAHSGAALACRSHEIADQRVDAGDYVDYLREAAATLRAATA